jgi:hypothetical protein
MKIGLPLIRDYVLPYLSSTVKTLAFISGQASLGLDESSWKAQ